MDEGAVMGVRAGSSRRTERYSARAWDAAAMSVIVGTSPVEIQGNQDKRKMLNVLT